MYTIYICFDEEFPPEFRFDIYKGHSGSSEVKPGSNPSNKGQIGPVESNIPYVTYVCLYSEFCPRLTKTVQTWQKELNWAL